MNNNYNSNTVVKQDFAVVEQVDGRVKSLESNCNVQRPGGEVVALRKNPPPLPDHAGSIPGIVLCMGKYHAGFLGVSLDRTKCWRVSVDGNLDSLPAGL